MHLQQKPAPAQQQFSSNKPSAGEEEESGSEESDGEEHVGQQNYDNIDGAYNPKDYAHLNVTAEIKDLFQYIERYKVQPVELETHLKCFIPDYIPSIGEMDAFIKVGIIEYLIVNSSDGSLSDFCRFLDPTDETMNLDSKD